MSDFLRILLILLLVLGNAVFVAGEYALVSARRSRSRARRGGAPRRTALQLMDEPVVFISTVQVGITVFSIAMGAVGTPLLESYFDPDRRAGIAFGDRVLDPDVSEPPSSVPQGDRVAAGGEDRRGSPLRSPSRADRQADRLALQVSANNVASSFDPAVALGRGGPHRGGHSHDCRGPPVYGVEQVEEELIYKVFDFADKEAHDVMVPRPEVVMISVDLPAQECLDVIADLPYTRYPAYRDLGGRDRRHPARPRPLQGALRLWIDSVQIEELLARRTGFRRRADLGGLMAEFRKDQPAWRSSWTRPGRWRATSPPR